MRDEGLFMSLVILYWTGDVLQDSQGVSASEMTYIMSGGAYSLAKSCREEDWAKKNDWGSVLMESSEESCRSLLSFKFVKF